MSGRIRSIKPELLEDERAAALSDAAWRLFVSSWLLCDDYGRFRAGARYLAAQVWQDTGKIKVAAEALAELVAAGRVRVYQVSGETYAEIPTWGRHQRIDNAGKERIPRPPPPSERDSAYLAAVSPRTSEDVREPPLETATGRDLPLEPPSSAASRACAPPRSGTNGSTDHDQDPEHEPRARVREGAQVPGSPAAPAPPSGLQHVPEPERGPLGKLVEELVAEGSTLGANVAERLAKGWRPTEPQLAALRKIWRERQQAPPPRSGSRGGRHAPQPAGDVVDRSWEEELRGT